MEVIPTLHPSTSNREVNAMSNQTYELDNGIRYTDGDAWFQNVPLENPDDPDGVVSLSTGKNVDSFGSIVSVETYTDGVLGNTLLESRCFHNIHVELNEELQYLKNKS